jgi:hypothetical protein
MLLTRMKELRLYPRAAGAASNSNSPTDAVMHVCQVCRAFGSFSTGGSRQRTVSEAHRVPH